MMKEKWFWGVVVIALLGIAWWFGRGIGGNQIGYVDMEVIFKDSARAKQLQTKLDAAQAEVRRFAEAEEAKLTAARQRGVSVSAFRQLVEEAQKAIAKKQEALQKLNADLTHQVEEEVAAVGEKVAKQHGVNVLFHKRAVVAGGRDLTQEVVAQLTKEVKSRDTKTDHSNGTKGKKTTP